MNLSQPPTNLDLLVELALQNFFAAATPEERENIRLELDKAIHRIYDQLEAKQQDALQSIKPEDVEKSALRGPPKKILSSLRYALGLVGLVTWVQRNRPEPFNRMGAPAVGGTIANWLNGQTEAGRTAILAAAIRYLVGRASQRDLELIENSIGQTLFKKEKNMPAEVRFYFDTSGLPSGFDMARQTAFQTAVENELANTLKVPKATNEAVHAAIVGLLLLDEHFDQTAFGFASDVQKAWFELLQKTVPFNSTTPVANTEIYKKIHEILPSFKTVEPDPADTTKTIVKVAHQEFAFIGRFVIERASEVPLNHPNFPTQVQVGINNYVSGRPRFESLDLPPLTAADGTDVEIEPDNIRAVSLVYAAHQLEQMRLFDVVDRITEIFMNGMLQIGFDAGGKALDAYYFASEDRMNKAARMMQYSRIFGAPGGDVSREVQPNREFEMMWMRFLASISEFNRQQRVADLVAATDRQRAFTTTEEHIRKAGRDLAANLSLYGFAYTHFAARRLNAHIASGLDILSQPSIQKAYGVSNLYQVIERVAANEFGQTPNIVKYRTMADAGKKIFDLVAKYHKIWSGGTGKPLFPDNTVQPQGASNILAILNKYTSISAADLATIRGILGKAFIAANDRTTILTILSNYSISSQDHSVILSILLGNSDITVEDRDELMRQTEFWLAVNGIKDTQVTQYSQPEESKYNPSIPSMGGHDMTGGNGAMDKLKQLVAGGQVPSMEQLRALVQA